MQGVVLVHQEGIVTPSPTGTEEINENELLRRPRLLVRTAWVEGSNPGLWNTKQRDT